MTKQQEALRLSLEALEIEQAALAYEHGKVEHIENAITAIKEALAQPEQEPVAWMRDDEMKAMVSDEKRAWILCGRSELIEDYNKPLYTTPPQRKPLTREVIERDFHGRIDFVRQVEAAHGIKE